MSRSRLLSNSGVYRNSVSSKLVGLASASSTTESLKWRAVDVSEVNCQTERTLTYCHSVLSGYNRRCHPERFSLHPELSTQ